VPPFLSSPDACSSGSGDVVMGTCRQGEEEAYVVIGCHSAPEEPRPLQHRHHRRLPLEEHGATDSVWRSTVQDGIGRATRGHNTCPGPAPCQTWAHRIAHIAYILQDKGWDMAHALHQL
jgi:hypothetical protein